MRKKQMLIEQVKKLHPYERLVYWITERESIRLKRLAEEHKPWTSDQILQAYRFTNVRRMDDTVSQWLLNEWYLPHFDHKNIVLAAVMARQFNRPETLKALRFPAKWDPVRVHDTLKVLSSEGPVFNSAYVITGSLGGGTKISQVVYKVLDVIYNNPPQINTDSIEDSVNALLPYKGFSHFMAQQVICDLRWAMSGLWADRLTWAAMGPGSRRGMNRLHSRDPYAATTQTKFLAELRDLIAKLKKNIPSFIFDRLEMVDLQSCLCESDKYERCLWGEGRPKKKYPGGAANDAQ